MDVNSDRKFLRQFSAVIAGFVLLTIALIFLARHMQPEPDAADNPSKRILAEQRTEPVGAVRVGEEGLAELAKQQAAAQTAPAAAAPAQGEETAPQGAETADGAAVYDHLCKTCHATGVAGAPIPGSDDFKAREGERGLDGLVQSALHGLNAMPPKGGDMSLTDEQIRATVEYMLTQ